MHRPKQIVIGMMRKSEYKERMRVRRASTRAHTRSKKKHQRNAQRALKAKITTGGGKREIIKWLSGRNRYRLMGWEIENRQVVALKLRSSFREQVIFRHPLFNEFERKRLNVRHTRLFVHSTRISMPHFASDRFDTDYLPLNSRISNEIISNSRERERRKKTNDVHTKQHTHTERKKNPDR